MRETVKSAEWYQANTQCTWGMDGMEWRAQHSLSQCHVRHCYECRENTRKCDVWGCSVQSFCRSNGSPMHTWTFDLCFNVVRMLWTLLVILHGRLGRFEARTIDVLFLLAQLWTVIHHPRLSKFIWNYSGASNDGTCTGRYLRILSCNFFNWNQQPTILVNDCTKTDLSVHRWVFC